MAKFHINGKGEPGACQAQEGNCPFGGDDDHYTSKDGARKSFESKNSKATFSDPSEVQKKTWSAAALNANIEAHRQSLSVPLDRAFQVHDEFFRKAVAEVHGVPSSAARTSVLHTMVRDQSDQTHVYGPDKKGRIGYLGKLHPALNSPLSHGSESKEFEGKYYGYATISWADGSESMVTTSMDGQPIDKKVWEDFKTPWPQQFRDNPEWPQAIGKSGVI